LGIWPANNVRLGRILRLCQGRINHLSEIPVLSLGHGGGPKMSSTAALLRSAVIMVAASFSVLAACSPEPAADSAVGAAAATPDLAQTLSSIRLDLTERNFGSAAAKAKAAQVTFATEPEIHLLAAQAEAHLGNASNAAAAFKRAMDSGLNDPENALANAAFNGVRGSEPFARLRRDLAAGRQASSAKGKSSAGGDHIRAGDVEIIADETGDYVRAGDVVLDLREQN